MTPFPNVHNGPKGHRSSKEAMAQPRAIREGFLEEEAARTPPPSAAPSPRGSKGLPGSRCGEARSASPHSSPPRLPPGLRAALLSGVGEGPPRTVSQSAQVPAFL